MQLVLATTNDDKIREVKTLLKDSAIKILTYHDFKEFPKVTETGLTLEENARIKALAVYQHTLLPALADDSGLQVDYLNGAPGVRSSRFAGEHSTYADNNRKLLELLAIVPKEKKGACFRCVMALALNATDVRLVEGRVEGFITDFPQGKNGFGYDPVFFFPPIGRTFAQLTTDEKNAVSHRGQALKKVAALLKQLSNHQTDPYQVRV